MNHVLQIAQGLNLETIAQELDVICTCKTVRNNISVKLVNTEVANTCYFSSFHI